MWLLFGLFACVSEIEPGHWAVTEVTPLSDSCGRGLAGADRAPEVRLLEVDGDEVSLHWSEVDVAPCERAGRRLTCELEVGRSVGEARVTERISVAGRLRGSDALEATLTGELDCAGSDCADVASALDLAWPCGVEAELTARWAPFREAAARPSETWIPPEAAWDPIHLDEESELLLWHDGERVPLETLEVGTQQVGWTASGGLAEGRHLLLPLHRPQTLWDPVPVVELRPSAAFGVGPWGHDEGFVAEDIVGTWRMPSGDRGVHVLLPTEVGDLLGESLPDIAVEIGPVTSLEARVRIGWPLEEGGWCRVTEQIAELSPTGELRWSDDVVTADAAGGEIPLYDAWFDAAFAGDAAAGVQAGALLDVRAVVVEGCEWTAAVGDPCRACPDDGRLSCIDVAGFWGRLEPMEPVDLAAAPPCVVPADQEAGSCEASCRHGPRGSWAWCALAVLALRRRTR